MSAIGTILKAIEYSVLTDAHVSVTPDQLNLKVQNPALLGAPMLTPATTNSSFLNNLTALIQKTATGQSITGTNSLIPSLPAMPVPPTPPTSQTPDAMALYNQQMVAYNQQMQAYSMQMYRTMMMQMSQTMQQSQLQNMAASQSSSINTSATASSIGSGSLLD